MDIMTGEKLSSIKVANTIRIYWSGSSCRRGRYGANGMRGGIDILAHCVFHFIRDYENEV